MPRRIPDYPDAFAGWNLIASYGSYLSAISSLFFFYVVYHTFVHGEKLNNKKITGKILFVKKKVFFILFYPK